VNDWFVFAVSACASVVMTGGFRTIALRTGMLDEPNERSAHCVPVARGGGVAIVAVSIWALVASIGTDSVGARTTIAWIVAGAALAVIGFVDDRTGISVPVRLTAHLAASFGIVWSAAGLPALPWFGTAVQLGALGWILGTLAIAWSVNLFNFMDGIDGLAAIESAFVFAAAFGLSCTNSANAPSVVLLAVSGASIGFLVWNWSPAKIFMGDAGSSFLGLCIGAAAICTSLRGPLNLWTWVILYGAFVADATVTLVTRWLRGDRVSTPHRSHAYQRLARHLRSHRLVTGIYMAVNLCWLTPMAAWSVSRPGTAPLAAAIGFLPLAAVAIGLGAGRPGNIRSPP
jgi:Fuc2NAc and GlcNAc transferase